MDPEREGQLRKKYKLYGKNRKVFLDGLQRYRDRGVVIRVDGKEAEPPEWIKILEEQPDGSFYMGDYIVEDMADIVEKSEREYQGKGILAVSMICEETKKYQVSDGQANQEQHFVGILKEIRFDRVYNR